MSRSHLRTIFFPGLLMAMVVVMGLAGCGSSASGSGSGLAQTTCASSTAPICTRTVQVNGIAKQVLVTPGGRTLYYFSPDSATKVACTGACATTWPPLLTSATSVAPISGLTGVLATVSRSEGSQITYSGHPLYTYSADSAPGDAKGQGINGKWFVAAIDLAPGGSNDNGYGY